MTSAAEVRAEVATAIGDSEDRMRESLTLLAKVAASLEADQG